MSSTNPFKYTSKTLFPILIVCGLLAMFLVIAKHSGWLQPIDLLAYDWMIKHNERNNISSEDIVIVVISETDIQSRNEWPLTDKTLAEILQSLIRHAPSVIGVDIYRDQLISPGTEKLVETFQSNANIFLVEKFSANKREPGVQPHGALVTQQQIGFSDVVIDDDGIVRRGLLFLNNEESVSYAISLRLAATHLAQKKIQLRSDPNNPEHLMLGDVTYVPLEKNDGGYVEIDASGYQYFMSYVQKEKSFQTLSLNEVLENSNALEKIRDKIVLVGTVAESVKDSFFTPLNKDRTLNASTPGVVLHALSTSQLLQSALHGKSPMSVFTDNQEDLWVIVWVILALILAFFSNTLWQYLLYFSTGLFALVYTTNGLFTSGSWLPIATPLAGFLCTFLFVSAYIYVLEKRQRNAVMDLFSRHVSQEVANEVWLQRDNFVKDGRLKAQSTRATILFTDLIGFTSTAEKMHPDDLMLWLNHYMELMADCVIKNGGMIDDYYGDAIKANFGVPIIQNDENYTKQNALAAVSCALEMSQQLDRLNVQRAKDDLPLIGMRVGIATGEVVAGSLGSRKRLKYTTIGDTVNIAARLESYGRKIITEKEVAQCTILIAESTKAYLDGNYKVSPVGELLLKGKTQRLMAYKLLANSGDSK